MNSLIISSMIVLLIVLMSGLFANLCNFFMETSTSNGYLFFMGLFTNLSIYILINIIYREK